MAKSKRKKLKEKPFVLSPTLKNKLPKEERKTAEKLLLEKSQGRCALCNRPLGRNNDLITADHRTPSGKTTIASLYLAHKSCNSSRGNLDFNVIRPLVEYKVFSEESGTVTYDSIVTNYVPNGNKQIEYSRTETTLTLNFGGSQTILPLYRDPATNTEFCFGEIPIEFILNDKEVQPRLITYPHVRKLALDFYERPVHEPSNCRLVVIQNGIAELRQFDGQHKTTAQILIGRNKVPLKIYLEPDIAMLQSLVIKIQQEIKKQPLTRSDTLAKLGDVISSLLDSYVSTRGHFRSEKGFIDSQHNEKKNNVKKLYFEELSRLVFFDEDNELKEWVKPGAKNSPTTDKVVIDKIIKPLIFPGLLDVDMDTDQSRDNERKLIILILNTIARKKLPSNWFRDSNSFQHLRTTNFFYQGSIGWWMSEILVPALRYILVKVGDRKPILIDSITTEQENQIIELVEALCDWPIWSTQEGEHLKAMRSNTVKNVTDAFKGYSVARLLKELG